MGTRRNSAWGGGYLLLRREESHRGSFPVTGLPHTRVLGVS
jgi:hypothetical protein